MPASRNGAKDKALCRGSRSRVLAGYLVGCVSTPARTPPLLGEHNREILCGIGGLTPGELDQLQADGAV